MLLRNRKIAPWSSGKDVGLWQRKTSFAGSSAALKRASGAGSNTLKSKLFAGFQLR